MASSNEFRVVVRGKGAHAAQPHRGIDPVMVAVQIAQGWQTIISREKNPLDTAVLSITQIHETSLTLRLFQRQADHQDHRRPPVEEAPPSE